MEKQRAENSLLESKLQEGVDKLQKIHTQLEDARQIQVDEG